MDAPSFTLVTIEKWRPVSPSFDCYLFALYRFEFSINPSHRNVNELDLKPQAWTLFSWTLQEGKRNEFCHPEMQDMKKTQLKNIPNFKALRPLRIQTLESKVKSNKIIFEIQNKSSLQMNHLIKLWRPRNELPVRCYRWPLQSSESIHFGNLAVSQS